MNDVERLGRGIRAQWLGGAALCCLLLPPGTAQAQYSPGGLVSTPLPSLTAATPGRGTGGSLPDNPPDFQASAFGDLSGRYTTNALGGTTDSPDFDTRAQLAINASQVSQRINASLNYSGSLDYFANHSSDLIYSNNLNASALAEVFPDHLVISTQAFATPAYASGLGNVAPSGEVLPGGANGDRRDTYGFSISPDLSFRLGDFLRSDTVPSYSVVAIERPTGAGTSPLPNTASNIFTEGLTQRVTSGDDFTRLQWSVVGSYSQMGRSSSSLTQRSATGELAYAINHDIDLIADGGYQTVKADVPLNSLLSGPIFFGGARLNTARINGEFRVGQQYRSITVNGHLSYEITPLLVASAVATDDVSAPGATLFNPAALLSGVIQGLASGQLQIPASGVLNLNDATLAGIGLQNTPSRIKTQSVSLQYSLDRFSAAITASSTTQKSLAGVLKGENINQHQISITPSIDFQLSENLSAGASMNYYDQTISFGHSTGEDFNVHSFYNVSDLTQLYVEGSYYQRDSGATLSSFSSSSGDISIFSLRLGIRRQIF